MRLYNSLTKEKEEFVPLSQKNVGMYSCGPTVYDEVQIGNLRSFLLSDLLRRTLTFNGYHVKQVMNITDVGHLVTDGDDGEDKMTKGLKREGKEITIANMKELADRYAEKFKQDLEKMNILMPWKLPKASEHIKEQIDLLKKLDEKEFLYTTSDGVYFDTSKDLDYGKLAGIAELIKNNKELEPASPSGRSRINENSEKKNPRDFAVWKFNKHMGWDSPWGKGFPGWHIECSGMSIAYLGESFDIHTGGTDLAPIHHNNEIAQSENATGKKFANYWLHGAFLNIDGEKMAKSGSSIKLSEVIEHGFSPLAYRYFLLQTHYRSQANFTWEALNAADNALQKLKKKVREIKNKISFLKQFFAQADGEYVAKFMEAINDDLDLPKALAITWELIKDDSVKSASKYKTLMMFDEVLGLRLTYKDFAKNAELEIPDEVQKLLDARKKARDEKNWSEADRLRDEIKKIGHTVHDTPEGQILE